MNPEPKQTTWECMVTVRANSQEEAEKLVADWVAERHKADHASDTHRLLDAFFGGHKVEPTRPPGVWVPIEDMDGGLKVFADELAALRYGNSAGRTMAYVSFAEEEATDGEG